MKHLLNIFLLLFFPVALHAVTSTYVFYNAQWGSTIGTLKLDNTSDGWLSDRDGAGYSEGRLTPQGYMYAGVQITDKQAYQHAGATSVLSFTDIRKIVVNYRTNASKGKGTIYIQVGDNEAQKIDIVQPEKGRGEINRDIALTLTQPQSGKVRFYVDCTENSIYINSITIKAATGSQNIPGLTADIFRLVTSAEQLEDGDQLIIGVSGNEHDYVMGLYDEWNSRNNIYALKDTYSADRQSLNLVPEAVYDLHIGDSDDGPYYALSDVDGYWIVASGGNPNHSNNNYLTIWDTIYSPRYGWYGAWDISVGQDGSAQIVNRGVSRSNKLQFNLNGGTPIFACYADWTQTKPSLYKRVVIDNPTEPLIHAPMCNFGTVLLTDNTVSGSRTITVNAVNLTDDISVRLAKAEVFAVDQTLIDRDGDPLTISYEAHEVGRFVDTLILSSKTTQLRVPVILDVQQLLTIQQAKRLADLTQCYLNEVVVTKKYDRYIFVSDKTGSMLLYDSGNLYGKDLKTGMLLNGVAGKYKNYYGNPEITLTSSFNAQDKGYVIHPEVLTFAPDSQRICSYVRYESVSFDEQGNLHTGNEVVKIYDLFRCQALSNINTNALYDVEGMVYVYNDICLAPFLVESQQTDLDLLSSSLIITDGIIRSTDNQTITIYNTHGQTLRQGREVSVGGLSRGVYIISIGNNNTKIIL